MFCHMTKDVLSHEKGFLDHCSLKLTCINDECIKKVSAHADIIAYLIP